MRRDERPVDRARVIALLKEHKGNIRQVALEVRRSYQRVHQILTEEGGVDVLGITRPESSRIHIEKMVAQGLPLPVIAEAFDISMETLQGYVARLGVRKCRRCGEGTPRPRARYCGACQEAAREDHREYMRQYAKDRYHGRRTVAVGSD